jgi:hypothetical protein
LIIFSDFRHCFRHAISPYAIDAITLKKKKKSQREQSDYFFRFHLFRRHDIADIISPLMPFRSDAAMPLRRRYADYA